MSSKASAKFQKNKQDIDRLWAIHEEVAGGGTGRKHDVEVLNSAAIMFITACWESFVEDLATEAFDFMLANVTKASAVPSKVQDFATRPIFVQKDSRQVWDLADTGWRAVLLTHRDATLKKWLDPLNTPKTKQVDELYEELLSIRKLSENWHWYGMGAEQAGEKLDEYITIRGNIAHRLHHDETVYKNWGTDYLNHVQTLVEKCDQAVAAHLQTLTGRQPW